MWTIWALYLRSDLAQLEVLCVSHAADQFLRLFAETIEFVVLVQVCHERLAIRVCSKLDDQSLEHRPPFERVSVADLLF